MNFKPYKSCIIDSIKPVKQNINLCVAIFSDFWALNMFSKEKFRQFFRINLHWNICSLNLGRNYII